MPKSPIKKLLDTHPKLIHSENIKVVSHVQRLTQKDDGDWWQHTLMLQDYDVPFKFKRKKRYQSLQGALVNVTYYPSVEDVAGIEFEVMNVVRVKKS